LNDFTAFRDKIYPLMVELYGEPAPSQQGRTVIIQNDATAGDGIYTPPPSTSTTSGGLIEYSPINSGPGTTAAQALAINRYNLARQMLIAFHGAQLFSFDAWELGFTDAAALIVIYRAYPSASFDPSQLGVYLLPIYDLLNRPELGNPVFFAAGEDGELSTSPNLGFYRAGMAQAAWLKVWVENRDFFKLFNAAYYAQYNNGGQVPLYGNTPALKGIATSIVPTVEGLGFADWYRRQWILDTAVTTGEKLWIAVAPLPNLMTGLDRRSVFFGLAQHYTTASDGSEEPLTGAGRIRAYDETGQDITLRSNELNQDNRAIFNEFGETEFNGQHVPANELPIIGFSATGTPDTGRITITLTVGDAEVSAIFPYNVAGTESAVSGYYGAVTGATTGTVQISSGTATASPALVRGAFGTTTVYPSAPRVQTTFTVQPTGGGATRVLKRNGSWSFSGGVSQSFAVLLETAPGNSPFPASWQRGVDNGLRMISLPLYPTESDEADVLGILQTQLLLGRYRPNLAPAPGLTNNGLTYGITADKYELYPNISEPFAPGRGYWLKLNQNLATTVEGGEPTGNRFDIPLLGGWNQIGVPFNKTFSIASVRVQYGTGAVVTYDKAIQDGLILPGVYRWNVEGGYSRVDTGTTTNQKLLPFEGYFIWSRKDRGVRLIFNRTLADMNVRIAPPSATNWSLPIVAETSSAADRVNNFGVTTWNGTQALRAPASKPPVPARTLTLSFLSSGNEVMDGTQAGNAAGWSESFVAPFTGPVKWDFVVNGAWPGEAITLSWATVANLPQSVDLTLVDLDNGQRTIMANVKRYKFVTDGSARNFRIEGKPRNTPLRSLLAKVLNTSHMVELTGNFGTPGGATLTIETASRGIIRTIATNQVVAPGSTKWIWDGKNSQGALTPAGTYYARLRLVDDRGVLHGKSAEFVLR
jgi:hypothetical protein